MIGPEWAPDPLRANQIFSWKSGLGSVKSCILSLKVAGTGGCNTGTTLAGIWKSRENLVCEDRKVTVASKVQRTAASISPALRVPLPRD